MGVAETTRRLPWELGARTPPAGQVGAAAKLGTAAIALGIAAAIGVLYLTVGPSTADLAAQSYRAGLFDRFGLLAWDNGWYAGHHLPSYSVLFPPLGGWLGVRLTGVLALLVACAGFVRLIPERPGTRGASAWFALALGAAVICGRPTFVLGCACALWAAVAAEHDQRVRATLLGALTALSSPVAAMFLALVAVARLVTGRPRGAWLAAGLAPAAVTLALVVVFPEGGTEPFVPSSFWPALGATGIALAFAPTRLLRVGVALYALLLVGAFVVPNPVGGNAVRLGALLTGPLAVLELWPDRRRALAVVALPLTWWTLYPAVRDWLDAHEDRSTRASYYAPLLAELARRAGPADRIEIPFTGRHWEAAYVAPHISIARGWERQLDHKVNDVFYDGHFTPARYERWLHDTAVRFVALSDAPLDGSSRAEARLVRATPPFLRELWHSEHWRLFAVVGARSVGATRIRPDGFSVAGPGVVRIRWSPYWRIQRGTGCLRQAPGGWTDVRTHGPADVGIHFSLDRIADDSPRCRA